MSSLLLICNGQMAYADALSRTRNAEIQPETKVGINQTNKADSKPKGFFHKTTAEFLYGYTDFKFNSTETNNFNRFQGHSNLYSAGADRLSISPSIMAGIYYFRINTDLTSNFSFSPFPVTNSNQTIKSNTIFGHVLKVFKPQIFFDIAAGYGYNQIHTFSTIEPGQINPGTLVAFARNNTNNWFVSGTGIYRKTWQKFLFRASLGVLYSKINTPEYDFTFPEINVIDTAETLINRATLLLESAEFGYYVNPKLMPFVNVGLIQVAQFSLNRQIISPTTIINGSLPQLLMNKDAFRLSAGLNYKHKNFSLRVEEKYYNASSTFRSYQTLVILEYLFT
jgi:hypothetical protein